MVMCALTLTPQQRWPHRQEVALVHELALALLQLRAEPPQLALVLAQQRALIHVLVHLRPKVMLCMESLGAFEIRAS